MTDNEEIEYETIESFIADIELRDRTKINYYQKQELKILADVDSAMILEFNEKHYHCFGGIRDGVKTEYLIDDFLQAIITFIFLGVMVMGYFWLNSIFDIGIGFNLGYILVMIGLVSSAIIFFLAERKMTRQKICLFYIGEKDGIKLWVVL